MTTYRGYEIGKGAGYFILHNGKDLFYGIKSMDEAKAAVDNLIFLRGIKW
jgi:hypothetical protein